MRIKANEEIKRRGGGICKDYYKDKKSCDTIEHRPLGTEQKL
jgi:hypothetical protein